MRNKLRLYLVGLLTLTCLAGAIATPYRTLDQLFNLWGQGGFTASLNASPPTISGFLTSEQIMNLWAAAGYPITLSGRVPVAQLGNGTANSTTYLDGTGNWTVPAGGGGSTTNATLLTSGLTSLSVGGTSANLTGAGMAHGYLALGSGGTAVSVAQPAFSDLSGSATTGQIPDLSATYSLKAGNASLVTVGTIGTGTWQGTKIGAAYGGTNLDSSALTGVAKVSSGTWSIGNITVAQINATGTPNSTTALFGDGSWQVPSGGSSPNIAGLSWPAPTSGKMVNAFISNCTTGNQILYTAPAGRRAAFNNQFFWNPTVSTITELILLAPAGGGFYQSSASQTVTAGSSNVQGSYYGVLEPGDSLVVNSTAAGLSARAQILEFPSSFTYYMPRLTSMTSGNNTLYTCASANGGVTWTPPAAQGAGTLAQVILYNTGSSITYTGVYLVPSGGSPGSSNQIMGSFVAANNTEKVLSFSTGLTFNQGDSIVIASPTSNSGQYAWTVVVEY